MRSSFGVVALAASVARCGLSLVVSPGGALSSGRRRGALSAATIGAPPARVTTQEKDSEVVMAECPLTQWGEPITDIVAAQRAAKACADPPFASELRVPAGVSTEAEQEAWLREHASEVIEMKEREGAVILRGWSLVETPSGFKRAYEALGQSPCLDPLHAVSARPTVASGVYEAVNKESRANFFIGMHNEFVGTRSPRSAMFVCFKAADEGGEFLLADGRKIFRDVDEQLLDKLYSKQIRYSVMELPFFGWIDTLPAPLASAASTAVKGLVSAAVNAKVDFDVDLEWLDKGASAYDDDDDAKTLQARAPSQPPVVEHPITKQPTWFCNVHSHSSVLRNKRQQVYGAERFESGASRINKSDMYFGDGSPLDDADLDKLDQVTNKHTIKVAMKPGDAVFLDNYMTMHGRNVFKGTRKHAVTWFE